MKIEEWLDRAKNPSLSKFEAVEFLKEFEEFFNSNDLSVANICDVFQLVFVRFEKDLDIEDVVYLMASPYVTFLKIKQFRKLAYEIFFYIWVIEENKNDLSYLEILIESINIYPEILNNYQDPVIQDLLKTILDLSLEDVFILFPKIKSTKIQVLIWARSVKNIYILNDNETILCLVDKMVDSVNTSEVISFGIIEELCRFLKARKLLTLKHAIFFINSARLPCNENRESCRLLMQDLLCFLFKNIKNYKEKLEDYNSLFLLIYEVSEFLGLIETPVSRINVKFN